MARRKPPIILTRCWTSCWPARDPQTALGRDGLVDELKRALAERALNAELDHHRTARRRRTGQQPQRLWQEDPAHRHGQEGLL